MIALLSTGYNIIDLDYAKEQNLVVCNVPAYSSESVAQLTFALILEQAMGVCKHSEQVKNGEWSRCQDFCFWSQNIIELASKTIGIIGYGSIGRCVAKIANAFGMKVLAFSRSKKEDPTVSFVDLDTLCSNSDFISIHCPLTNKTENLINKALIEKMKKTAYIINTARGPIVNEEDVAEALNNDRIAGFCADVLKQEPPKEDNPLLHAKNVYITPHIAWASLDARKRLLNQVYLNIKGFLESNIINNVVE